MKISLGLKDLIVKANEKMTHVYFPLSGVLSSVIRMSDGGTVEVATVGNEGYIGTQVFLGAERSPMEVFSQIPGESLKVPVGLFLEAVRRHPEVGDVMRRYAQALMSQISQSTACNHLHSVEERMCRWLLMMHDRVGSDELLLTQEFLSQMLCVRRATITVVAARLEQAKLIDYGRGRIKVLDRKGLEEGACECYEIVRSEFERLFA